MLKNKKAQTGGLITNLIMGVAGLVIGVIIAFVIVQTLVSSNLLTTNSIEANATTQLRNNFTAGVNNVSSKIPTVLLIAAVVLILAVMVLLVGAWKNMNIGSSNI